ncbi:hypothetical protein Tco_0266932 [Tanacetum coccineum]
MPSGIRSFLGLAGYYRRFIVNFSKIAKPLTSLDLKNMKNRRWAKEQEEAFQMLKGNLLCTHAKRQGRERDRKIPCGLDQLMERKEGEERIRRTMTLEICMVVMYGEGYWFPLLPRSSSGYDTNWVIVDRLTKSACVDHLRSWWKIYFEALVDIAEGIENTAKTCAEVGESGLIRLSWYKRQPTRVEVGDKVMLEVSSWKDVVRY